MAHHAAAGELWTQAARYLRAAADRANERFATTESAGLLTRALHALEHVPATRQTIEDEIDIRLALRGAWIVAGDLNRLNQQLRVAERRAGGNRRQPASRTGLPRQKYRVGEPG